MLALNKLIAFIKSWSEYLNGSEIRFSMISPKEQELKTHMFEVSALKWVKDLSALERKILDKILGNVFDEMRHKFKGMKIDENTRWDSYQTLWFENLP